jgi:hypothetical protein
MEPVCRDGVEGGGTQRQCISTTGETLFGPAEATPSGREAYKGEPRKRSNDAEQGVGGGRTNDESCENQGEGRAATSIQRSTLGKAAGLPPQGKAQPRSRRAKAKSPARLEPARKLQRTLYRVAKQQSERRFTLLHDKVYRQDILQEAWQWIREINAKTRSYRVLANYRRGGGCWKLWKSQIRELRGGDPHTRRLSYRLAAIRDQAIGEQISLQCVDVL